MEFKERSNFHREIEREKDPEVFFQLFESITGMRTLDTLANIETENSLAKRGCIEGAVVVGSSTEPGATPKDLDLVLVTQGINGWTEEFVEELRYDFDLQYSLLRIKKSTFPFPIEHGRLDFLGYIPIKDVVDPIFKALLKKAPNPQVYAFSRESAHKIQSLVDALRAGGTL